MFVNRNPEYFLTIVREKNISRAAEKLFVSQSSLSQHLAKLEAQMQTRLLDRSRNPLELTPAGKLYQNYLESSLYLNQRFQASLSTLNEDRFQTVNLGLGTWRGSLLIPEILPDFLERNDRAIVNLQEFPVSELLPLVQNGTADFVVMNTNADLIRDAFVLETIGFERILLAARRDLPLAKALLDASLAGRHPDLGALSSSRFISLNSRLTVGNAVENFLEAHRIAVPRTLTTTNNETALQLTAAGLGYCFVVETGVRETLQNSGLVLFDLGFPDLTIPLSIVYRKNTYPSAAARELMEAIRSYYKNLLEKNREEERIYTFNRMQS